MTRDEEIKAAREARLAAGVKTLQGACEVCDRVNVCAPYDGFTCPCGQVYEYDECLRIVLTDAQLDLLRRDEAKRRGGR